jgi:hypothetical protein
VRRRQCVADNERVAAECFAIEKYAARQTERRIEAAVERTVEPGEFDAEIAQEAFGHIAPQCFWRLDRLAAAIADQCARPGGEFVALGVAAEIVVIVENENAGLRTDRATIEPCRGEAADAAADHDQIVSLFAWRIVDAEAPALAREGMRDFERAGMLAAQASQRRRILRRRGGDLIGRRQSGGDRQGGTAEKIAARDGWHPEIYHRLFLAGESIGRGQWMLIFSHDDT